MILPLGKRLASLSLTFAAFASVAKADTLTWDPGHTSGSGGTGVWDLTTTADWFNGTADVTWKDNSATGTNSAIFTGTPGTVTLNSSVSTSNLQFTISGYTLSGAATLTLGAGGIDASTLFSGSTTIGTPLSLASGQQSWLVGSGSALAVNGAVSRLPGAAVDFAAAGVTSSSLNNVNGILGGWATVGGLNGTTGDWAANDGSGNIVAYSGYTVVSSTNSSTQTGAGASTQNWNCGDSSGANNWATTLSASATLNSLVQQGDFTVNSGVTLTLGSGGLLFRGPSRWMLGASATTSFLTSGASTGELFVHSPDPAQGNWTLWPIIKDNGVTPLKLITDGAGAVKVGNQNTYSGGTIVNNGVLAYTGNSEFGQGSGAIGTVTPFGTGSITVNNGAQLQLGCNVGGNNFSAFTITNPITLNNAILYEDDGFFHVTAPLTIGTGGATLGATFDNKGDALIAGFAKGLFVDGLLVGTGNITIQQTSIETVNPWDSSTVYFTSSGTAVQNTYSGTIAVNPFAAQGGSYLFLIGTSALANATIELSGDNGASNGRFGSSTLLFGSGTNADGIGYATIGGLSGSGSFVLANTRVTQAGSSIGGPFALTVGNNNSSSSYSGVMSGSGSLTKVGTGTLTLAGANTYTGDTTVGNGTLSLAGGFVNSTNFTIGTGATLDVSALGTVTIPGNLVSGGTLNGSLNMSAGSKVYAGTDGGYGTNAITGSLSLPAGAALYLDLGTVRNGANDLITVGGALSANNTTIHLKAPNSSVNLDSTGDYVLISAPSGISGTFATAPAWDVPPANESHYSIVTGPTTVTLHYAASSGPTAAGSATPLTALRNQGVLLSVTATNGNAGTVNSVVVDASTIGGSSSTVLVAAGGNVWTNTIIVGPATVAGGKTLAVTVTDTASLTGVASIPLTVIVGNDIWNGSGANNNFSTALNWASQMAPGFVGDSLEFGGTSKLSPNMDNNYTVTALTFDSGAGSFTIGSGNGSSLTLSGNLLNNSANLQTLNVPIAFTGAETINASAGNVSLSGTLSGPSNLIKTGSGSLSLSGSGSAFTGILGVIGGTLNITGGSSTFGTALSYAGYETNNGNLNVSGGSLTTGGELWVGGSDLSGTAYNPFGTLTVSGANVSLGKLTIGRGNNSQNVASGLVTLNSGTLSSENDLLMGFAGAGSAKFVMNGGTFNLATATKRWLIVGQYDSTTSEVDVNGGQMNINANTDIRFATGSDSSSNTFNLNAGAVTFYSDDATTVGGSGVVDMHQGTSTTVINTFNLNGGTLTVSGVTSANTGGTRNFNFNGGTLKATAVAAPFMNLGTGSAVANVRNGGAIVDDGGFAISIDSALVHSTIAGDNAADGGLTKFGIGTLSLSASNSYSGETLINAGALALTGSGSVTVSSNIMVASGATFDVSGVTFTLGGNQALSGSGTNNGSVAASADSKIYAGTDGTYGTNTFNNNLALASSAACYFDLGTAYNGANDLIVVSGTVTASGNPIHIKAPNTSALFDSTADYVLIASASPISGTFATVPVWDVPPANAGHFTVVTSGNTVTLHYNAVAAPIVSASANPATVLRNQPALISANVLPGSSAISTVTVDLTPLGGSVVSLVQSNGSSIYTNSATVPATQGAGSVSLNVTATDTSSRSGSASASLTIKVSTEVWSGGGGNPNWSTNPNWASGYAPGYIGDSILFAGGLGLTPNMDTNYTAGGLAFSNNASAFTIGTSDASTLTLTANGIVNNSTSPQTINVPVNFAAPETISAASGNIIFGSIVTNSGGLLTVGGSSNVTFNAIVSGAALTKSGSGITTLNAAGNLFSGNLTVMGGALNLPGGNTTFGNVLSYVGYDANNGNLTIGGGGFTNGGDFWVGGSDQNGSANTAFGTLTISGGANVSLGKLSVARGNWFDNTVSGIVTMNSGTLSSESDLLVGFAGGGSGKVVLNGGTFNEATTTKRWIILSQWDTASSEIDVNGGQLNVNANTDIRFAINGNNGTNVFNLNGGAVTFYADNATTIVGGSGVVDLHQGNGTTVVNTFNLNGGTLTVSAITAANSSGTKSFNFNGGTLKAVTNNSTFLNLGSGSSFVNVRNGGAIIDDGGFSITIGQSLQHSTIAGDNATDGGLTKQGTGILTLGSANSYNGNTTVKAGTLEVVLPTLAASASVSISNGATLQLDFASTNQVGALVLNGVAQSQGVYNSGNTAFITGTGSLLVPSAIAGNPTNITFAVSGGNLHLSWPNDHLGWILQMQTNSLSKGIGTNWVDVSGSGSVTSTNIAINPAIPTEFYRLRHP